MGLWDKLRAEKEQSEIKIDAMAADVKAIMADLEVCDDILCSGIEHLRFAFT